MGPLADLARPPQENFPLTCSSAGDKAKARAPATQRNEKAGLWRGVRDESCADGEASATSRIPRVPTHLGETRNGREADEKTEMRVPIWALLLAFGWSRANP